MTAHPRRGGVMQEYKCAATAPIVVLYVFKKQKQKNNKLHLMKKLLINIHIDFGIVQNELHKEKD